MAKKKTKKKVSKKKTVSKITKTKKTRKSGMGLAIVSLILNIIFLPGLGTLIGGKTKAGIWQLILMVAGIILTATYLGAVVGVPLMLAAWVWGIVSGINLIQEAQ